MQEICSKALFCVESGTFRLKGNFPHNHKITGSVTFFPNTAPKTFAQKSVYPPISLKIAGDVPKDVLNHKKLNLF